MDTEKNWNESNSLKWGITIALFLVGLFCMLKSYGYCCENDYEYTQYQYFNEFDYIFPEIPIPVEEEYLRQFSPASRALQHLDSHQGRTNYKKTQSKHEQRHYWGQEYDFHHCEAVRTYNDAYNRVWWLPDLSWRQLGRDAWVAACGTAGGSNPNARLVIAFATLLSSYGLHCLDEWEYIQDKLYWSKFHFEKCAYFANLLQNY
jgi:hypothetical protein